ncbi:hypothetical protein B0H13DRAFT_1866164 [Mycena leptocephala]|nr:hypothetical protein B0H13DRAFT_1866164 [Mycena leptocephala]
MCKDSSAGVSMVLDALILPTQGAFYALEVGEAFECVMKLIPTHSQIANHMHQTQLSNRRPYDAEGGRCSQGLGHPKHCFECSKLKTNFPECASISQHNARHIRLSAAAVRGNARQCRVSVTSNCHEFRTIVLKNSGCSSSLPASALSNKTAE